MPHENERYMHGRVIFPYSLEEEEEEEKKVQ